MAQRVGVVGAARVRRALASRFFPVYSLVFSCILIAGIGASMLIRVDGWPPPLEGAQATVAISGPGVAAPSSLQAYVLGAVRSPGVYKLPRGSRVRDAITAAGGAFTTADLTQLNLASEVADGQSIYVPVTGEVLPLERNGKVDINMASADQLHAALGISPTIAKRIVAYRGSHGDFTAVSQLLLVPVSLSTYDKIKNLVTV